MWFKCSHLVTYCDLHAVSGLRLRLTLKLFSGPAFGSGGTAGLLVTRRLVGSLASPSWEWRCPWGRHLPLTAPHELAVALRGRHRPDVSGWMCAWMGECEAILWSALSGCCLEKRRMNAWVFSIYWGIMFSSFVILNIFRSFGEI